MGGGHAPPGCPGSQIALSESNFGSGLSATISPPNMPLTPAGLRLFAAIPPKPSLFTNFAGSGGRLQPHKRCLKAWCS